MRVYEKPPMFLASFLRFMAFRELLLFLLPSQESAVPRQVLCHTFLVRQP